MKKTDVIVDSLLYAFYMLISCLVCMIAEILIIKVLNLFVGVNYFVLCIIRSVVYTVGVNAILYVTVYHQGYKAAKASVIGTVISGAVASVFHFFFCLLFSFEAFCAGGVKFITALVKFGPSLSYEYFDGKLDRFDCIAVFFINAAVYCAAMAISKKLGALKRLSDRAEMTSSAEPTGSVAE